MFQKQLKGWRQKNVRQSERFFDNHHTPTLQSLSKGGETMTEIKEKAGFICVKDTIDGACPSRVPGINAALEGMGSKICLFTWLLPIIKRWTSLWCSVLVQTDKLQSEI